MENNLIRLTGPSILAGLCAGLAYYFKFPTWCIRLLFVALALCIPDASVIIFVYLILVIAIPKTYTTPSDYYDICE